MVIISGIESQLIAVSFIAIHLVNILVGAVLSCVLPLLMCLFCSFRSSFQNSACSFQKQRNCRYSNFPYFSGFLRCNRQKSLKYQAFRQILSRPKPPSKIAKQPLIHKTRNPPQLRLFRPPVSLCFQGFSRVLKTKYFAVLTRRSNILVFPLF